MISANTLGKKQLPCLRICSSCKRETDHLRSMKNKKEELDSVMGIVGTVVAFS
jgi:hypothetical protein